MTSGMWWMVYRWALPGICGFDFKEDIHWKRHYNDAILSAMASQITSLTNVYWTAYWSADKRKTSKLRVTGLCEGNSPVTGEFYVQRASNAENVSIWWHHHGDSGVSVACFEYMPSTKSKRYVFNKCDRRKIAWSSSKKALVFHNLVWTACSLGTARLTV